MSVYLDASVLLPTLVVEPTSAAVDNLIKANEAELVVSDFAAAEVASAISRLARMSIFDVADAQARLLDFDRWRAAKAAAVDIQASDVRVAETFVRRFELQLRAPDALHLAICRRAGLMLASSDKTLLAAALALNIPAQAP